jgi:signal transduction histidine kinase
MMDVEQPWQSTSLNASTVLAELLNECRAIMDYRTLRDSLPRRLAHLLQCRCVLLYQRIDETLQFAAGTFDDVPGWSASLLSVAHINPIDLSSDLPEAHAWRKRQTTISPAESPVPSLVAVPLIYRQHAIGVLVAFRNGADVGAARSAYQFAVSKTTTLSTSLCLPEHWSLDELPVLEAVAGVVALLLENTRLLERDQQRIAELSLLNSIANQLNYSMYDLERLQHIVMQHTREITSADLCTLLLPTSSTLSLPAWITPALSTLLFSRFGQQKDSHLTPLTIERPGNSQTMKYLNLLPTNIKTFFAIPLFVSEATLRKDRYTAGKLTHSIESEAQQLFQMPDDNGLQATSLQNRRDMYHSQVLGIVVGACYRARKLRREELVLLQVVTNQASIVLENIRLMSEVVEARNAARKLLRRVLDDVASMQLMEEEKRRLDRLASLGEMAASVAHEVRNPLASIKTSVQILKDDLMAARSDEQAYAEAQESIEIVLQEVVRLDAIVRDLLLFAKPRQLHRIACNLTELSDHVLHMMRSQCAEMGVVVQRVYHNIPLIKIDMAQMEQVLFNLYMNAIQAMPDGGVLTITCQLIAEKNISYSRIKQLAEKAIDFGKPIGMYGEQQHWLELVVSDTGTGIAPDQLERIFQPFFTTKAHGIGLGLPITRRLIEDHGGHMIIESKAGCGTRIAVRLPIEEEDAGL